MKFTTDSYIEIGSTHNICEDYSLNGIINGEMPYIIVCDGCSSSKMTDFGARILAHACKMAIHERYGNIKELLQILNHDKDDIGNLLRTEIYLKTINVARTAAANFCLPYTACDATLLYAFIYDKKLYVTAYGDGNIIINRKKEDGTKLNTWINLTYESNAPFYLSYKMDMARETGYLQDERFGKRPLKIDTYDSYRGIPDPNPEIDSREIAPKDNFTLEMSVEGIESITLSSDGMESYSHVYKRLCENPMPTDEEIQSLKPYDIMHRMVEYKNHNGEFVKRRMKRMRQEVEAIQGEHYDDVSSATIWVEHD